MNHDDQLDRLVSYCYFRYQNIDLINLLESKDKSFSPFVNLHDNLNQVTDESKACFLGFLARYNFSYLMYAYKYKGKEYGFAWETYYDESVNDSDLDSEPPWYAFITQGQMFTIKVNKHNPFAHYIIEKPFSNMNGVVIRLGPCRDTVDDGV